MILSTTINNVEFRLTQNIFGEDLIVVGDNKQGYTVSMVEKYKICDHNNLNCSCDLPVRNSGYLSTIKDFPYYEAYLNFQKLLILK